VARRRLHLKLQREHLIATLDLDIQRVARLGLGHPAPEGGIEFDFAPLHLDDPVARLQTGLGSGAARVHFCQPATVRVIHTRRADVSLGMVGIILRGGRFCQAVPAHVKRRHRHMEVVRGGSVDGAVDADNAAVHVEQRTARVARADRAVGLERTRVHPNDTPQPHDQ